MERVIERIKQLVSGKTAGILGFGREGQSTYRFLREHFRDIHITIADRDETITERISFDPSNNNLHLRLGKDYLEGLSSIGLLFKSPGVELPEGFVAKNKGVVLVTQTELMLSAYSDQVIGVTGTKGKSTTASLIHHTLNSGGIGSLLMGNIGTPPFDLLPRLHEDTLVVFELSSHQLEGLGVSPHIGILLNLFPEHLDRYRTLEEYYGSKWNIFLHQKAGDYLIAWDGIPSASLPDLDHLYRGSPLRYGLHAPTGDGAYLDGGKVVLVAGGNQNTCCDLAEDFFLKGQHNKLNMLAAILACHKAGMSFEDIIQGLRTFRGLEHRLEFVGNYRGIDFYNDSIATIPQATVEALKTIPNIGTLILGGYDRGLEYGWFIDYLMASKIQNIIFLGKAGERMLSLARAHEGHHQHKLFQARDLHEAFDIIMRETQAGLACLLSPAAASYDSFKSFEERGQLYKKIARSL